MSQNDILYSAASLQTATTTTTTRLHEITFTHYSRFKLLIFYRAATRGAMRRMRKRGLCCRPMSVCLSIGLSVTFEYCINQSINQSFF